MKILARSVLMLLALGFSAFGDVLDSPNLSTNNLAVTVVDSDADQEKSKCRYNPLDNPILIWDTHSGGAAPTQVLPPLLDTSSTPRYTLLSVYRI